MDAGNRLRQGESKELALGLATGLYRISISFANPFVAVGPVTNVMYFHTVLMPGFSMAMQDGGHGQGPQGVSAGLMTVAASLFEQYY